MRAAVRNLCRLRRRERTRHHLTKFQTKRKKIMTSEEYCNLITAYPVNDLPSPSSAAMAAMMRAVIEDDAAFMGFVHAAQRLRAESGKEEKPYEISDDRRLREFILKGESGIVEKVIERISKGAMPCDGDPLAQLIGAVLNEAATNPMVYSAVCNAAQILILEATLAKETE